MADVKWIKITTDIFNDEKIQLIESMPEADTILTIWFKILCLAGKCNKSGLLMMGDKIPYTDDMLIAIFRRNPATVRLALETFKAFGMIEIVNGAYALPNWEKHQNEEKLADIREKTRLRVAEYRKRQSQMQIGNVTDTLQDRYGNAIEKEIEIDTKESNTNVLPKKGSFRKPSVGEVQAYCSERNNGINAEEFWNFYESKGWVVGKSPMKDWKACVRTWEQNERRSSSQPSRTLTEENDEERARYVNEDGSMNLR